MSEPFHPEDWPHLREATSAIQAYADERWPDLNIVVKMEVKACLFQLDVYVQKRATNGVFTIDRDYLQAHLDPRKWVIDRITATVALPDQFHV